MPRSARAQLERRRPGLVVAVPALLLFSLVLLCAALLFGQNFERPRPAGRWIGSTVLVLSSAAALGALLRALWVGSIMWPRRERDARPVVISGHQIGQGQVIRSWRFTPRWKEQLECASAEGGVVLEMMMYRPHVYFPTEETWARMAPGWARHRRAELLAELEQWCAGQRIPITVDERAWIAPP